VSNAPIAQGSPEFRPLSLPAARLPHFTGLQRIQWAVRRALATAFVPANRPKSPTQPFGVGTTNIHTSAGSRDRVLGSGFRVHSSGGSTPLLSRWRGRKYRVLFALPCLALHLATSHIDEGTLEVV